MTQEWKYYVPILILGPEDKLGFTFRIAVFPQRLDENAAWSAIIQWSKEILGVVPQDKDDLPIVPLGWTLLSAKQGSAVEPKDHGTKH